MLDLIQSKCPSEPLWQLHSKFVFEFESHSDLFVDSQIFEMNSCSRVAYKQRQEYICYKAEILVVSPG